MARVSVIIPNYNHSKFLRQRIDSVLEQTYQDFDLTILDDCSTDDSRDIIEQYRGHSKVRQIIYNEVNTCNTFIQWERGIGATDGDYIWIAESDDYCEPTFLEELTKVLDENPRVAYCHSGSVMVDAEGVPLEKTLDRWETQDALRYYEGRDYIYRNLTFINGCYNASMVLFRRSAYMRIKDDSYKRYRHVGDWLFWLNMAKEGDVCVLHKRLNYFRQHSNKVTENAKKNISGWAETLDVAKRIIEDKDLSYSWYFRIIVKGAIYKYIILDTQYTEEQNRERLKEARKRLGVRYIHYWLGQKNELLAQYNEKVKDDYRILYDEREHYIRDWKVGVRDFLKAISLFRFWKIFTYTMRFGWMHLSVLFMDKGKYYKQIEASGLFDTSYYMTQVENASIKNPLKHYIREGWKRGYNPSIEFDSDDYRERYKWHLDRMWVKISPLEHFVFWGRRHGLTPNSVEGVRGK
ncbi:MAG: glycosyltransferase [Bacteroidia bacterium]|nr:glycosyltransferase [Bacteroidia bacterium]